MAKTKEQLLNILDQFQLTEKVVSAEPFGNGRHYAGYAESNKRKKVKSNTCCNASTT